MDSCGVGFLVINFKIVRKKDIDFIFDNVNF